MGFGAKGWPFQARSSCCSRCQNFNFKIIIKIKIPEMQKIVDFLGGKSDVAVSRPRQIPAMSCCPCIPTQGNL